MMWREVAALVREARVTRHDGGAIVELRGLEFPVHTRVAKFGPTVFGGRAVSLGCAIQTTKIALAWERLRTFAR